MAGGKSSNIRVEITGDASGLKKATKDATDAIDKVDDKVDNVGKKSGKLGGAFGALGGAMSGLAANNMGPLGDAADALGVNLEKIPKAGMAAAGAVAAVGTFVAQGVGKWNDLVTEVRKFKDATGTGWDDASTLVAVMDDLGISSDAGGKAVSRLTRAVAESPDKFAAANIEIAKTASGATDVTGTLANVADRFAAIKDPAERAALGNRLFGKSWAELVPLIEQGGGAIRESMAGVKDYQRVNEESARQQREYSMALDDAQDAISGLQMALAKDLIPEMTKSAGDLATLVNELNDATQAVGGLDGMMRAYQRPGETVIGLMDRLGVSVGTAGGKVATAAGQIGTMAGELGKAAAAAGTSEGTLNAFSNALDESARAALGSAKANADLNREIQEGIDKMREQRDALLESFNSQLAYEGATRRATDATDKLTQDTLVLDEALRVHGEGTVEVWEATKTYEESLASSKEAALQAAGAAVALARDQAAVRNETMSVTEENAVYMASLERVRDTTNDPNLKAGMQSLIDQLAAQNVNASNAEDAMRRMADAARSAGAAANDAALAMLNWSNAPRPSSQPVDIAGLADGGVARAGQPYVVGERGPELMVPHMTGRVVPNEQLGMGGQTINVTVNGMMATDLRTIAQGIREELRKIERAQR